MVYGTNTQRSLLWASCFFTMAGCLAHPSAFEPDSGESNSTENRNINIIGSNATDSNNSHYPFGHETEVIRPHIDTGDSDAPTDSNDTGRNPDSDPTAPTDSENVPSTETDTGFGGDSDSIPTCTGCLIETVCYGDGELNPENSCQICRTDISNDAWSADDGKPCDDGLYCTENDTCDQGQCIGTDRVCDDGVGCNGVETCDDIDDTCADGASTCDEGQFCDMKTDECTLSCGGCEINGSCYQDGDVKESEPCLACDVSASRNAWTPNTGAACDDDSLCTENDQCTSEGDCGGTQIACESDADICGIKRTCQPNTGCVSNYPGNSVTCNDNDSCTVYDRCNSAGQCIGTPMSCNDALDCTQDTCVEGQCDHLILTGHCLVDKGDGINKVCIDEHYVAGHDSCLHCAPSVNPEGWTPRGGVCKYNNACYAHDVKHPGVSCLTCDGGNWSVDSGQCYINSGCYQKDDENTANRCEYCDTNNPNQWTVRSPGTSCGECQICSEEGECDGVQEDMCLIQGNCYNIGEANSENECQICNAVNDQVNWSPEDAEVPCGSSACTVCDGDGACNTEHTPCCLSTSADAEITDGLCGSIPESLIPDGCVLMYDWEDISDTTRSFESTGTQCQDGEWTTPDGTADEEPCPDCTPEYIDRWYTTDCDFTFEYDDTCEPPQPSDS